MHEFKFGCFTIHLHAHDIFKVPGLSAHSVIKLIRQLCMKIAMLSFHRCLFLSSVGKKEQLLNMD